MNRHCWWAWWVVLAGAGQAQEGPDLVQWVQRGEFWAAQGQLDSAIVHYERARQAGAGSAQFLNRLGQLYFYSQNFGAAVEVFELSLREEPGQIPVYAMLRDAFLAQARIDSAIFYVAQALELVPDSPIIHSALGGLLLQNGQAVQAKGHLDTALRLDPNHAEAHRFLGLYYTGLDSVEKAIAHYQRVVELLPQEVEPYNNIAFLHLQQRRFPQALEHYQKAKERAREPYLIYALNEKIEAVRALMDGKMRARYILVKTRAAALDVHQRLEQGEDFGQLARQHSQAPNARDGGDVGFFGPGELMPQFEEAVLQLEVGQVSQVVEVPAGFVIIQRLN